MITGSTPVSTGCASPTDGELAAYTSADVSESGRHGGHRRAHVVPGQLRRPSRCTPRRWREPPEPAPTYSSEHLREHQVEDAAGAEVVDLGGAVDAERRWERDHLPVLRHRLDGELLSRGRCLPESPRTAIASRARSGRATPPVVPARYWSGSTPIPTRFDRWIRS